MPIAQKSQNPLELFFFDNVVLRSLNLFSISCSASPELDEFRICRRLFLKFKNALLALQGITMLDEEDFVARLSWSREYTNVAIFWERLAQKLTSSHT